MGVEEIVNDLRELINGRSILTAGAIVLISLVEISPIKINPWSWIKKILRTGLNALGDIINHSVIDKIDTMNTEINDMKKNITKLQSKIDCVEAKDDERDAINTRNRILAFGDDLMHGILHSKDSYEQSLLDVTHYNTYCDAHPEFKNHITEYHAKLIQDRYAQHLNANDFLE